MRKIISFVILCCFCVRSSSESFAMPSLSLQSLEEIVLRYQGLDQDVEASMIKRSRHSAFLPKLTLFSELGQHMGTSEKKGLNADDILLERGGRDIGLGIKLSFDLDKLIYNDVELEVRRLAINRFDKRQQVITSLHKNYFRFVRLKNSLSTSSLNTAQVAVELELKEVQASLDSLSGGEFSRRQGQF